MEKTTERAAGGTGDFIHVKPEGFAKLRLNVADALTAEGDARFLATVGGWAVEAAKVNRKAEKCGRGSAAGRQRPSIERGRSPALTADLARRTRPSLTRPPRRGQGHGRQPSPAWL